MEIQVREKEGGIEVEGIEEGQGGEKTNKKEESEREYKFGQNWSE